MCLNEKYSRVLAGKHLSDMFANKNGLKQGDGLSPSFFNFVIRMVQEHQESLKLNSMYHLIYADYVNILGGSIHTIT
jgi:hypothetical protein